MIFFVQIYNDQTRFFVFVLVFLVIISYYFLLNF